jgi:predicted ATPase
LEEQFPETTVTQPELLAHHFTEAGLTEKAVHYWHRAAQRAVERSAHAEAIEHLHQGLALLETLAETPDHVQQDVDMHIALGVSLRATKGSAAPEVGQTYTYARERCRHLEDPQRIFPVLPGVWNYYFVRAELQTAHTLGEQLLTVAQQAQNPAFLSVAHRAVGITLTWLGDTAAAHAHFRQGIALYDSQQDRTSAFLYGEDTGVSCCSYAAWTLSFLGYPTQGRTQMDEALALAQQLAHPFSLTRVLSIAAMFYQSRREVHWTQKHAEAAISLATEKGFPLWRAVGSLLRGWALTLQGQEKEGIEQMHQGLIAHRATGAEISRPHYLMLLAEAHGTIGKPEAGLTALAEALTLADTTGERWYEAELYRLRGELLLQQHADNQAEAESCFHHALDVAQNQQAKSFELRAATSLARLWHQQGKREEARQVLGDVYGWFTEGFDTADLKDAKALLDALE